MELRLRDVVESDIDTFCRLEQDPVAHRLAGIFPRDEAAFREQWETGVLPDPATHKKTILADGEICGFLVSFKRDGRREVGYWIAREHWGRGIASRALKAFLDVSTERPLYAIVAKHNVASRRVAEKCGFRVIGSMQGERTERYAGVAEWMLELREP